MGEHSGEQPATIYTVARRAGVSTATVSRVLQGASTSDSTRTKVLDAARALAYTPTNRPRPRQARLHEAHGLVLPDLQGAYCADLLLGHDTAAAGLRQSVVLLLTKGRDDAHEAVRDLAQRVDGLIVTARTVTDALVASLARAMPVLLVARTPLPGCDVIRTENVVSATRLTAHLLEHGHKHLAFVGDPDTSPDVAERYEGYRLAHAAAGMPIRRPPLRVPLVEGAGIAVAEEILRRRVKLDGIVCGNDAIALAAMRCLQDNGLDVPTDMAVVGWGDVPAARYVTPGLTTVHQPMRELGRLAAERLHARVGGDRPVGPPEVLPTQVVIRSSCGCP